MSNKFENKLYIEYRVYFDPKTNQDLLKKVAEQGQKDIYNLFDGVYEESSGPLPSPHDITYEIVMEAKEVGKI